ncbi:Tim44 domain-containing protein [Pseudochelatococcus sp. G4_1912]|uniref:Tim44 domain-containing protein n=1 Tax=Pseudochelatococcus sp. G4_1912 TaxID=3114288 RepID=UPI0039C6068D
MFLSRRGRVMAAVAATLFLTAGIAEARMGRGGSFGSRGTRTYNAPAPTNTAPSAAPIQRSTTPQAAPSTAPNAGLGAQAARPGQMAGQQRPGMFGGGFGGALMGGLLGAGLFGLLSGAGLFGGMSGFGSLLGLLLQIGLIVLLVRFAMNWFRRRQEAGAQGHYARTTSGAGGSSGLGSGIGSGLGLGSHTSRAQTASTGQPIDIGPADYATFERLLIETQDAYSREDLSALRRLATPEVASYFSEELTANASNGVVNRVSDINFMQGDLAEAWREGESDYATVAMKFSLRDVTFDRTTNTVVDGDPTTPITVTEIWTFRRMRGGDWLLSALQQE